MWLVCLFYTFFGEECKGEQNVGAHASRLIDAPNGLVIAQIYSFGLVALYKDTGAVAWSIRAPEQGLNKFARQTFLDCTDDGNFIEAGFLDNQKGFFMNKFSADGKLIWQF